MADRVGHQLGNYQLIRLLGSGGFADVYLGEHIHLGTQAAIKVLTTRLTNEDVEGFRTEARTIARLKHPAIVRVLEFGVESGTPFLVMDYAPHGTLRARHPKGSRLAPEIILLYVRQVADALQYAHEQKLIHRDIKPENMLIGDRQEVLLSDFGIATVAQSSRYQGTQEVAGTVAYMAPEQVQGHPRPASDQYSLGVVIYEWLTGTRPFHGSFAEIATQHVLAAPPPLREKVPDISPLIEQAVTTALAKDPKERFASVQAFANALEQTIVGVSALPFAPTQIVRPSMLLEQPTVAVSSDRLPGSSPLAPTLSAQPVVVVAPSFIPPTPAPRASQPMAPQAPTGVLLAIYRGHSYEVNAVAWSPDGRRIASGSDDEKVQVWHAINGRGLLTYRRHSSWVQAIAWSPDGARIASASRDGTIQVWDANTGQRLHTFGSPTSRISGVAWSPDGRRLAAGVNNHIQVWDSATGATLVTCDPGETARAVAWSPDGQRIASGSAAGVVQVWDAASGTPLLTCQGHISAVQALAWSPDAQRLASGGEDKLVQVWDAARGGHLLTYRGHAQGVAALAWSPDGKRVVSGGADRTVQIWDVTTGTLLSTYRGHSAEVRAVAWSPEGQRIASASADKTVQVWQALLSATC